MEQEKVVDYMVFESSQARMERQVKRMYILCFAMFAAFVISNVAWIVYESQFTKEVTQTVETSTDGGGDAYGTLIDGSEVHYGESESK